MIQSLQILSDILALLALAGCGYTVFAAGRIGAFRPPTIAEAAPSPAISILKPLHGWQPGLEAALLSFAEQDYDAPVQLLFGVQDPDDTALPAAQRIAAPMSDAEVVIDPRPLGANAKISNVSHIAARARHDVLVLSDGDIRVGPHYLQQVATALAGPAVGVVTCPYYGEAQAGFWSRMAAMGISYQFLPSVAVGVSLGMADPCMGSTIALTRDTLRAIGGYEAFADVLADDYAIGQAVRGTGARSVVAPILVAHGCSEASFAELVAHELRWARTIRGVDPAGFFGSAITYPVPLALLACLAWPGGAAGSAALALALASRFWLLRQVNRAADLPASGWWLLPFRDVISFGVFLASLFGRDVEWRGRRYRVDRHGVMSQS